MSSALRCTVSDCAAMAESDGFEKRLDGGVIITITFAAHRDLEAIFAQQGNEFSRFGAMLKQ